MLVVDWLLWSRLSEHHRGVVLGSVVVGLGITILILWVTVTRWGSIQERALTGWFGRVLLYYWGAVVLAFILGIVVNVASQAEPPSETPTPSATSS